MKYTYRFANGDVNEIEVSENQAFALADLDRLEFNNDHANTRRHISLEMAMEDEGMQFGSVACWEQALSADNVNTMLTGLSDEQAALIRAVFIDGITVCDIAKQQGVSQSAITQRLQTAKKKIKNILCDPYI